MTQENVVPIDSLSNLPHAAKGTTLVEMPYTRYSESELAQIGAYVANGGTLLLLDDYGYGNQVLGSLNAGIEYSGKPLVDPLFDYRTKLLPKITDFASDKIATNVSSVVFNHATTLKVTDAKVVAYSSSFSFLDENNNQKCDAAEATGPLPVIAYQQIGQGYVVAFTDPSMLINSMIGLDDNRQLVGNAIRFQAATPEVFIDQSHLDSTALDHSKSTLDLIYQAVASPVGAILLVTALLAVTFYPIMKKVKE